MLWGFLRAKKNKKSEKKKSLYDIILIRCQMFDDIMDSDEKSKSWYLRGTTVRTSRLWPKKMKEEKDKLT